MKRVLVVDQELARTFFGQFDHNIRQLEKDFGVTIAGRGSELIIKGARKKVLMTQSAIEERLDRIANKKSPILDAPDRTEAEEEENIYIGSKRQTISAKSAGQKTYVDAIRQRDIVVGIGPAGTGKTYLAVALAIESLRKHQVERIIFSRPAIEAGEKLGFLPGDLEEKIRPYLQPIYDAFYDLVWPEEIRRLMDHHIVEIIPLAYMRGRTLSEAFVILDEAQNATPDQMKMFLTRLGVGSKAVVTGDVTQSDLPMEVISGLEDIERFLKTIPEIQFVYFGEEDVVRHPLVREIIRAYENEKRKRRDLLAKPPAQGKGRRKKSPSEDKESA